jgi:hypothetical protein
MIVFIGQVGSDFADREAFQEVDYRRMYGSIAKWAAQIDRAERIPEYVAHAYRIAMAGRPGPVVLALPEDMLAARATCADAPRVEALVAAPDAAQVAEARALLAEARRPLVLVGGSRWDEAACAALRQFAEVTTSRSRARFATSTSSTTATATMPAMSASASIPASPRAFVTPMCCSSSVNDWARSRRPGTRFSTCPRRGSVSFTCIPTPRSWGASTSLRSR